MEEWRKSQNVNDEILMLSDGSANLTKCTKILSRIRISLRFN